MPCHAQHTFHTAFRLYSLLLAPHAPTLSQVIPTKNGFRTWKKIVTAMLLNSGDHTVMGCRATCVLLTGFHSFQHNHCQAVQLQCAMHSRDRLFAVWRRTVKSKVADWMHGPCLASTRRRLHLKGWVSEHQWHQQYQTHR